MPILMYKQDHTTVGLYLSGSDVFQGKDYAFVRLLWTSLFAFLKLLTSLLVILRKGTVVFAWVEESRHEYSHRGRRYCCNAPSCTFMGHRARRLRSQRTRTSNFGTFLVAYHWRVFGWLWVLRCEGF